MMTLFLNGGASAYGFVAGCSTAVLALMALLDATRGGKSRRVGAAFMLDCLALCLPFAGMGARLFWVLANTSEYSLADPLGIIDISRGGLSMWGAMAGLIFACGLCAKRRGICAGKALDGFASGMLLFVGLMRAAEIYTGQGVGKEIVTPFFANGITAVLDEYGEARFAVYRYESFTAFILFAFSRLDFSRQIRMRANLPGERFCLSLMGYAAFQIVFESMRDDDIMRLGFVRYSQVIALAVLLALALRYISRLYRLPRARKQAWASLALILAGTVLAIRQEFRVDAAGNIELRYLIMLCGVFFIYIPALFARGKLLHNAVSKRRASGVNQGAAKSA